MNYELQLSFSDQDVKDQVQLVLGFGKRTIEESFRLGEMLVFKKQEKKHGKFIPFLEEVGLPERTATRLMTAYEKKDKYVNGMTLVELTDGIKSATVADLEEPEPEDPFKDWNEEERKLKDEWNKGKNTVIINMHKHPNLVRYAADLQVYVRIDRGSAWGNPFIMDADGTRDEVCDWYEKHYIPYKKSLRDKIKNLKGKILGCYCYPSRCHGETLKRLADEIN